MKYIVLVFLLPMIGCSTISDRDNSGMQLHSWITMPDRSKLLTKGDTINFVAATDNTSNLIEVDTTRTFQTMDGFGFSLTGGSAYLLNKMLTAENRSNLLRELFLSDINGIGISYLRISIGASDLDEKVFSYNDLPKGETDLTLSKFSIDPDQENLIPVLKEILALNPEIKIMASPWSAPMWMKTNGMAKGGSLKKEHYPVYANYLVKYIEEMKKQGIEIDAITVQNEPEHPGNTPSMTFTSKQQNEFVRDHLGPAFRLAGITTKIVIYDHNCDHPEYPIEILNDSVTRKFVDGTAFHMYLGDISAMNQVHEAHPDKNLYFTEQWTSGQGDFGGDLRWHVKNLIVGAPRNWSRVVLEWNLAADENFKPHTTDGGCDLCQGALTIHSNTGTITRNVSYYIIAHAARFVPPGSIRIASNITDNLYNVAFRSPEGKKIIIVVNDNETEKTFSIGFNGQRATLSLAAGAVGTYEF